MTQDTIAVGLYVRLEVEPGKESDVAAILQSGLAAAVPSSAVTSARLASSFRAATARRLPWIAAERVPSAPVCAPRAGS